jgi:L-arabinose isomerase
MDVRPKIVLVHPYWRFWEESVPGDLRQSRIELLAAARDILSAVADIVKVGLLDSTDDLERGGFVSGDIDAVVILSTMAAPPAPTMTLLDTIGLDVPVVLWALCSDASLPEDFSHADITSRGATVGTPLLGSAIARSGRPFEVVLTTLDSPGDAVAAVRSAAAAGRFRRSTILRIGRPIDGYTGVDASDEALSELGLRVVHCPPADLARRAEAASAPEVDGVLSSVRSTFIVDPDVSSESLQRAARIEIGLTGLVAESGAAAGALNCHVSELRLHQERGVAPCLALGRLTSESIPWTCSGDVVTAVAMLAVALLGYPTLYHEIEAVDFDTDEVVLANTGEHDRRLCAGRPALKPNVWYASDRVPGPCAQFTVGPGPATLVAFTFAGVQPRFVVAEGAFTGRSAPATGTPHTSFRFSQGPVTQAWRRWALSGVTHHSVATNAHIGRDVEALARHLGVETIAI